MREKEAKTVLTPQNGMNIYRGCTVGCMCCDPRSKCYRFEGEFTDVEVKINGPALLEKSLKSKRRHCMIGVGSMSDPYQPLEKELGLMRKALAHIHYYGFGVAIETRSDLVLRDLDYLKSINEKAKCVVIMPINTAEEALSAILEPSAASVKARVEALLALREAGITTIVSMAPFLPFINDTRENVEAVLGLVEKVRPYGVLCKFIGCNLRDGSREYFYQKLDENFPGMRERYEAAFGKSYDLVSENNKELMERIRTFLTERQILSDQERLRTYLKGFEDKLAGVQIEMPLGMLEAQAGG
ncbi:MAG: radical SAM protein [Lachnospiraceae bacterium]|nr:radical SAM protein [Lachnospiraceae bacterium]